MLCVHMLMEAALPPSPRAVRHASCRALPVIYLFIAGGALEVFRGYTVQLSVSSGFWLKVINKNNWELQYNSETIVSKSMVYDSESTSKVQRSNKCWEINKKHSFKKENCDLHSKARQHEGVQLLSRCSVPVVLGAFSLQIVQFLWIVYFWYWGDSGRQIKRKDVNTIFGLGKKRKKRKAV